MMSDLLLDIIESALGVRPVRLAPMSGGCVAQVVRADLPDGLRIVAKIDDPQYQTLATEAFMLRFLKERTAAPVPEVIAEAPGILIMQHMPGSTGASGNAEEHAAEILASLHAIGSPQFGFDRDTVIGSLPQPNPWTESWIEFFREHRLLFVAQMAMKHGALPATTLSRIERFAEHLDEVLGATNKPSLIHGDVWSGNVLSDKGRITALIDPAIYFADAEIELAFIGLFSTFGDRFYAAYNERRTIREGFFESRRDVYNLYPLLVHVRLFGGHYAQSVESTLKRFGC